MADIKSTKSILAKLLAQEDVKVQHEKIPTAYFDVKNRVLGLPIWKDMSGELYDLLTGHEVGHALYTPAEGWHNEVTNGYKDYGNHFKGFLNVLEDARIEKKIKRRYPGIGPSFYKAYQDLWEKDFFEVKGKDLNDLLFIDRINILTKVGSYVSVNIDFSEKEQEYIERVNALETWEEVVALAKELYTEAKEELKEKQQKVKMLGMMGESIDEEDEDGEMMDFDMDFDFDMGGAGEFEESEDGDDLEPKSLTDDAFRKRERELLDSSSNPYLYLTVPKYDSRKFVVPYSEIMKQMKFGSSMENHRKQSFTNYTNKNRKFISYLIKEFEMRRNASQLSRAKVARSGELDVKKAHLYRLSDDLFRKFTIMPQGKNHGLVIVFDMSSSMSGVIADVIEQMLVLVQFCQKVNIKFEVYGFTNYGVQSWVETDYSRSFSQRNSDEVNSLQIKDKHFRLHQFFTDTMSSMQFKKQVSNMALIMDAYDSSNDTDFTRYDVPDVVKLHSTPLHDSLLISGDLVRRFKERTKADVVNMVYLTDGESDYNASYRTEKGYVTDIPRTTNVVLKDAATKVELTVDNMYQRGQRLLAQMLRASTGANVVNFHICSGNTRREVLERMFDQQLETVDDVLIDKIMDRNRKDKVAIIEERSGYNELYVIKSSNMAIEDDVLENTDDKKQLARNFIKMQKGKLVNRVLLNRFIQMIS